MQTIRSVLWIGDAASLCADAIGRAAWLECVWEPDLLRALELKPARFGAVVLAAREPNRALIDLIDLCDRSGETPVVLLGSDEVMAVEAELLAAGARTVAPLAPALELEKLLPWLVPNGCRLGARLLAASHEGAELGLLGNSRAMRELRADIHQMAASDANVLIQGETGTGKERAARAIHGLGRRRALPLVALNCASFPETLLEVELLGAVRGAYTGAEHDRRGLIEQAQGGSLFLDEIAEAPPSFQVKLLRVLQERTVRPLGGRYERPIDVRVMAATHRDLREEVAARRFRADLYYRICVLRLEIPPLRERVDDLALLAQHFLRRFAARDAKRIPVLEAAALRRLEAHRWPGNVRELENEMQRVIAYADGPSLRAEDLSMDDYSAVALAEQCFAQRAPNEPLAQTVARFESLVLRHALEAHDGRRRETARSLGITREGLYKKLKRLGIE